MISANPQTTFIIDQAYVAFTTEDMLKPSDVKTHKNLILVQSISKAYISRLAYRLSGRFSGDCGESEQVYHPWCNAIAIEQVIYLDPSGAIYVADP